MLRSTAATLLRFAGMAWRYSLLVIALSGGRALLAPRVSVLACARPPASSPDAEPEPDVSSFYAALRSRSEELESGSAATETRWRTGACVSRVAVAAGDWVRRMAYDDGVAAFGTASGAVGVAAISGVSPGYDDGTGWVAEQPTVVYAHPPAVEGQDLQLRALHGDYDGGGITALALRGALCVSGGRDGAVKAFAVDRGGGEPSLSGSAATLNVGAGPVSGVAIGASGRAIYAVALDGSVKAFSRGEDGSWAEAWSAFVPSPLLCVALDERRSAVIVGSDSGAAHAYSLADGRASRCGRRTSGPAADPLLLRARRSTLAPTTALFAGSLSRTTSSSSRRRRAAARIRRSCLRTAPRLSRSRQRRAGSSAPRGAGRNAARLGRR